MRKEKIVMNNLNSIRSSVETNPNTLIRRRLKLNYVLELKTKETETQKKYLSKNSL